ncbi:DinB family protein [Microscilla marina]|uniref:DinB superfamily protein n=1 Tax=Microscilla marina ATCC 23134 TaxID=313606 RepID=A1ZCW4_MICM2|nr:DinB family protein [Microscilla marina]EAY31503.1 hypothetical protein M23134_05009 [Microscilla marina ATCC 23134]
MTLETLISIYQRDLDKLKEEILAYPHEQDIWKTADGISNSGGTLALHLIGNLNHFIGASLGNTGYVRDREAEFALRDVPRQKVIADIDEIKQIVGETLTNLPLARLTKAYPLPWRDKEVSVDFMLIHLLSHLGYHLGQVNYHRRILSVK